MTIDERLGMCPNFCVKGRSRLCSTSQPLASLPQSDRLGGSMFPRVMLDQLIRLDPNSSMPIYPPFEVFMGPAEPCAAVFAARLGRSRTMKTSSAPVLPRPDGGILARRQDP